MSKDLRGFISENRKEFDSERPSAAAWENIEDAVSHHKPVRQVPLKRIYRWSAAAAVFFIVAVSAVFFMTRKTNTDRQPVVKESNEGNNRVPNDIGRIDPAYAAEAKKIYQSIEKQQKQLKAIAGEQPELYTQFSEDLAALDSAYRVLKSQAVQTPNREVIIRAMLQNLQLQAELLAKQLNILNEINNDKPDQHEKNNSPRI